MPSVAVAHGSPAAPHGATTTAGGTCRGMALLAILAGLAGGCTKPTPPVAAPAPRVSAVARLVVPDTGRIDLTLWAACDVPLSAVDLDVLEDTTSRWLFARLREDRGAVYTPSVSVSRSLVTPTVLLGANVAPGKVPDVLRAWGDLLGGAGPSAADVQTSASRYPLRESVFGRQSAWLAQVHLGAALTHGATVEGWRTITPLLDGFSATKVAGVLGRCPEVIVRVTGRADPDVDREVRAAWPDAAWFEQAPADKP